MMCAAPLVEQKRTKRKSWFKRSKNTPAPEIKPRTSTLNETPTPLQMPASEEQQEQVPAQPEPEVRENTFVPLGSLDNSPVDDLDLTGGEVEQAEGHTVYFDGGTTGADDAGETGNELIDTMGGTEHSVEAHAVTEEQPKIEITLDNPNEPISLNLSAENPQMTLGREGCIAIDDARASREHCQIVLGSDGETITVEDLDSSNGTYVNEVKIMGRHTLVDGDIVRIGRTEYTTRLQCAKL